MKHRRIIEAKASSMMESINLMSTQPLYKQLYDELIKLFDEMYSNQATATATTSSLSSTIPSQDSSYQLLNYLPSLFNSSDLPTQSTVSSKPTLTSSLLSFDYFFQYLETHVLASSNQTLKHFKIDSLLRDLVIENIQREGSRTERFVTLEAFKAWFNSNEGR